MNKTKVGASWIYACFFTIAIALLASCTTHLVAPYDQSNQTALATISSDIKKIAGTGTKALETQAGPQQKQYKEKCEKANT